MNIKKRTIGQALKKDIEYLREIITRESNKLEYDEYFGGWCIGETPLRDWIYENENTLFNPKELEGYMEQIIEDELKLKR